MALSTEFVAKADEYQTIIQTLSDTPASVYIPDGVWMCSLTANVSISRGYGNKWIELDGSRASVSDVDEAGSNDDADLGVVVPSLIGGRSVSIRSGSIARATFQFYAAKIGY